MPLVFFFGFLVVFMPLTLDCTVQSTMKKTDAFCLFLFFLLFINFFILIWFFYVNFFSI